MRLGIVTTIDRRSRVARATIELALALAGHHDVVVFAEPTNEPLPIPLALRTIADVARTSVDHLIVVVGDSGLHRESFNIARELPSIVICHDVVLAHLVVQMLPPPAVDQAVRSWYGHEIAAEVMSSAYTEHPLWDGPDAVRVPLFEPVLQRAEGVIVHSSSAASVIASRVIAPMRMISLPAPQLPPIGSSITATTAAPSGTSQIVALNEGRDDQHHEVVLEALAELGRPGVRYVIVGPMSQARAARLEQRAGSLGVAEQVRIVRGATNAEEQQLVSSATLCIHLREIAAEGGSLALLSQMAASCPVLVVDHGCYSELPDDAVVKVPVGVTARALAAVLARWLDDADARRSTGERAAAHIAAHHGMPAYVAELESFLTEVEAARPIQAVARAIGAASSGWGVSADSPLPARWVSALGSMLGSLPPEAQIWPDRGST